MVFAIFVFFVIFVIFVIERRDPFQRKIAP
jgi:hypothetical protein